MATRAVADDGRTARRSPGKPFMITVDIEEKLQWQRAAAAAGVSTAEYVRLAVRQAADTPTAAEIAEAEALTVEFNASVDRMVASLDRTLARIAAVTDPDAEAARRREILADLDASGLYLDLDLLADRVAA